MIITGTSSSRLSELEKYTITSDLSLKYRLSTDTAIDGLDLTASVTGISASTLVYYLGGITYNDNQVSGQTTGTTFSFSAGTQPFLDDRIVKDESLQNLVEKPRANIDVFIERQEISILENNYRLRDIRNLSDLTFYAGGGFFNIIKNT
jgi:hypothetical protein